MKMSIKLEGRLLVNSLLSIPRIMPEVWKWLEFSIPGIAIKRNDNSQVRDKIMSIDPEKRKELKINKSTLWYQQKRIKEGKTIKIYHKTEMKIK